MNRYTDTLKRIAQDHRRDDRTRKWARESLGDYLLYSDERRERIHARCDRLARDSRRLAPHAD